MSKNLISLCPVVSKMSLTMSAGILLLFFLKNAQLCNGYMNIKMCLQYL